MESRSWNGVAGGDALFGFGIASDIPVTGDWDGDESPTLELSAMGSGIWI